MMLPAVHGRRPHAHHALCIPLLAITTALAHGQTFMALRVEGPSAVRERMTGRYTATAVFDTGKEYDVTLSSTWSVNPDTYAEFDFPGRLRTRDVPGDQLVVVEASFTWEGITRSDALDVTILDSPPENPDPWPTWGRTTTRIGNTATVGPQTPRIEWSVKVDFGYGDSPIYSSCSMDAFGRIYQGQLRGVTAVDSISHEILWTTDGGDVVGSSPSVFEGRVFWGVTGSPSGSLYCSDAANGNEIWRLYAPYGYNCSPVVDDNEIVYFNDRKSNIYARMTRDGNESWTVVLNDDCYCPFSLDPAIVLVGGKNDKVTALVPGGATDPWEVAWTFDTGREVFGTTILTPEVAYIASTDRYLYALNRLTGTEKWRFYCEQSNRGSLALGHDGTIYTATGGNIGWLFAISSEGQELWRFQLVGKVFNSPIVAGDGTIYVSATEFDGNENPGFVHAIRANGTQLWSAYMPWSTVASPMLAPDGTLYIACRDQHLYAFRDPAGDLNYDQRIDLTDYAHFDDCMTAPRIWGTKSNTRPGCELLDFDRDWDVDLADYAAFQNAFGTSVP